MLSDVFVLVIACWLAQNIMQVERQTPATITVSLHGCSARVFRCHQQQCFLGQEEHWTICLPTSRGGHFQLSKKLNHFSDAYQGVFPFMFWEDGGWSKNIGFIYWFFSLVLHRNIVDFLSDGQIFRCSDRKILKNWPVLMSSHSA